MPGIDLDVYEIQPDEDGVPVVYCCACGRNIRHLDAGISLKTLVEVAESHRCVPE